MRKPRRSVTPFDAAAAAAVLAVFLFPLFGFRASPDAPARAVIEAGGVRRAEPLAPDRRVEISGPLGVTVIEVAGGRVRVAESPCSNQLCVRSGSVGEPGRSLVCAPNRAAVFVEGRAGGEEDGIDGIAR